MPSVTRKFVSEKLAAGGGGDRYEEITAPQERPMLGKVYIQQWLTRPDRKPLPEIEITITTPDV